MGTAELGVWLGLILALAGQLAVLFGGYAAHRWFAQDERVKCARCGGARLVGAALALFLLLPKNSRPHRADAVGGVACVIFGPGFCVDCNRLVSMKCGATTSLW